MRLKLFSQSYLSGIEMQLMKPEAAKNLLSQSYLSGIEIHKAGRKGKLLNYSQSYLSGIEMKYLLRRPLNPSVLTIVPKWN